MKKYNDNFLFLIVRPIAEFILIHRYKQYNIDTLSDITDAMMVAFVYQMAYQLVGPWEILM